MKLERVVSGSYAEPELRFAIHSPAKSGLISGKTYTVRAIISRIGYVLYAIGIVLLVSVLVHGKVVSGSRRWFDLGVFHLQPSVLMKVLTIIALAKYIHDTPSSTARSPAAAAPRGSLAA